MSWLEQVPQPIIFAHRGASAHAPENTLAAFRLAVELGAPAIELDAKLTSDKKVVVFHDLTVDRTTNGKGPLKKKSLAELRELDAGSSFSPQFAGESIPTLEEVFECVGRSIYINVELTSNDGLPDRVAELINRFKLHDRVLFSSFITYNLLRIKRLLPQCPAGLLASVGNAGASARGLFGEWITPHIIHPYTWDVTEAFMTHQRKRNRRVHVWTVNDVDDMQRLFGMGVHGIFTDDPQIAFTALGKS